MDDFWKLWFQSIKKTNYILKYSYYYKRYNIVFDLDKILHNTEEAHSFYRNHIQSRWDARKLERATRDIKKSKVNKTRRM